MSSITSWNRLESRTRDADMRSTPGARIFDPLWLLTRQWQMGEFQAEDAGTPILARLRATSTLLSRCYLGDLPHDTMTQAPHFDPLAAPLEVLVERRAMRPRTPGDSRMLRASADAGLHFLHMLDQQPLSADYRPAFSQRFGLQPPSADQLEGLDDASIRYIHMMAGRVPDARRLAAAFANGGAATVVSDPALKIAPADRAEVRDAATRWLEWYAGLFSEPDQQSADAWQPSRLEYAVSVAGRLSDDPFDERTLSASEFSAGYLEWSSFDLNYEVNMGTTPADRNSTSTTDTSIPAPVTFPGAPAQRFWEFEDARVEYGLTPVDTTDLAQLLLIEYASSYGNDWFVIPLDVPVGSMTVVDWLVVTDTFGVGSLLRPIGDRALPAPHWSMWQMAATRRPGTDALLPPASNLFFLPPTLGRGLDGSDLEDVLFMRDEMANLAWAIERTVETPIEVALPRVGDTSAIEPAPAAAAALDGAPRYLLASSVPANWVPYLPVQVLDADGKVISRLRRGAVLAPDGSQEVRPARTQLLGGAAEALLYDEEVPREGIRVTRRRRLARWVDGSSWLWTAHRKFIGRGEGSSGLRFDTLEERQT